MPVGATVLAQNYLGAVCEGTQLEQAAGWPEGTITRQLRGGLLRS